MSVSGGLYITYTDSEGSARSSPTSSSLTADKAEAGEQQSGSRGPWKEGMQWQLAP